MSPRDHLLGLAWWPAVHAHLRDRAERYYQQRTGRASLAELSVAAEATVHYTMGMMEMDHHHTLEQLRRELGIA